MERLWCVWANVRVGITIVTKKVTVAAKSRAAALKLGNKKLNVLKNNRGVMHAFELPRA
jgi:hypothetical protein